MANNMLNLELLANRRARRNRNNAIRAGQIGTMMNPGTMSALPPTMTMRAGEVLTDYLSGLRKVFPEANPIGQAIEDFMLQPSEEMAAQMVEGNPYAVFDTRAGQQLINPVLPEAVGLAPVGAIAKTPGLVAPAAIYAAGRGAEGLLGITDAIKKAQAEAPGLVEGLLSADPRMNVMMAQGLMAPEPRFKQPDYMGFRSTVEDVVNLDTFPNRGSAEQMEAALGQGKSKSLPKPVTAQLGNRKIDKEELKFLGITDLLEEAKRTGQPVTKEQIQNVIESNRSNMYLEQEVLENIPSEANLRDEVISYEDSYGQEFINDEIDYLLTDNEEYAKRLADNPDDEDAIRDEIYQMLEENYNYEPTQRIRLLDNDGDETEIYAVGSDDMGWTIRKGGDNWDDSETLTVNRDFQTITNRNIDRHSPMEISNENEARVQLELLANEEGYSGEGALHRQYVAEDAANEASPIYRNGGDMGNISGEPTNYREIVVRSPETAGGDIGSHYGDDVAYHMRVSDRKYTPDSKDLEYEYDSVSQQMRPVGKVTREDALYVDEIQSDYAQAGAGRKMRLTEDEQTILDNLDIDAKTKNLALSRFDTPEAQAAKEDLYKVLMDDFEAKKIEQKRIMTKYEVSDNAGINKDSLSVDEISYHNLMNDVLGRLSKARAGATLKEQPLVAGQEKWVQHAVKNLITEMVETGKDRVIFTSGKNQADYWGEKGLEQFYDVRLKKEVEKVLKGIDKDAFEIVKAPSGRAGEEVKHISIKNTQKIKDFLEGVGGKPKGFGMYSAAPVAVGAGLLSGQQENNNATTSGAGLLGVR